MVSKKFLIKTAFWIAVATFGSRLLGFLREVQLAYYFGLTPIRGAFTVAFKIPNLLRLLVADAAISAAFIPILTEYLVKENKEEAWKISSQMINLTFFILSIVVIVCELFMPAVIRITTPGFAKDPALFMHTVRLSRIIFPIIIILGVSGVVVGVLHSLKHFSMPALAPLFWNIVNLSAVYFLQQHWGIYAAAWGLIAATLIQLWIQGFPLFFKMQIPWKQRFSLFPLHPAIRKIGYLMIPVTLSLGIINFNVLVDNFFASLLGPDKVAAIDSAFRLFHLPQGMFAIAIGTVLFPVLSHFVIKHDIERFTLAMQTGLRQIFFVTLPFTGWFIVLSLPIARLCFERGSFTEEDSQMVAWALLFFSLGMSFTSANTLLNRGFYSLKKTWLPLLIGGINIILNGLLDWILMKPFGHGGICFSTSLVSTFNFIALCYLMKREIPEFHLKPILLTICRTTLMTMLLAFVSYYSWKMTDSYLEHSLSLAAQLISLSVGILSGAVTYVLVAFLCKCKEVQEGMILFKKEANQKKKAP